MDSKRILIAEDDRRLLQALSVRLKAQGYEVICCQDAYHALQAARREQPDLLLLDINMPAGDGFSVQERMADIEEVSGIPIIYLTGEAPERVDHRADELGAFAILHKPVKTSELLATIATVLKSAGRMDPAA